MEIEKLIKANDIRRDIESLNGKNRLNLSNQRPINTILFERWFEIGIC